MTLNTSLLEVMHHACTHTPLYQSVYEILSAWLYQIKRYNWGKIKKTGHVTLTTPLLGVFCHRRLRFDTVYLHAKLDDSILSQRYH